MALIFVQILCIYFSILIVKISTELSLLFLKLFICIVTRVPRSLLPGARSSRLRDRQKEERELLVKKAFIEDMLTENKLLSLLLKRGSTYRAIIWDPDLLPYASKDSELPSETAAVSTVLQENVSDIHSKNNTNQNNLLDEMSLYMENLNYLYLNDDDLSCDFQVDSGTLACVACGILGYPFMSVVQPSEGTLELLPADHLSVLGSAVLESKNTHSCPDLDHPVECSVSGIGPFFKIVVVSHIYYQFLSYFMFSCTLSVT